MTTRIRHAYNAFLPAPEVNFAMRRTNGQAAEKIAEVVEIPDRRRLHAPEETARERLLWELRADAAKDPKGYVTSWEVRGGGE